MNEQRDVLSRLECIGCDACLDAGNRSCVCSTEETTIEAAAEIRRLRAEVEQLSEIIEQDRRRHEHRIEAAKAECDRVAARSDELKAENERLKLACVDVLWQATSRPCHSRGGEELITHDFTTAYGDATDLLHELGVLEDVLNCCWYRVVDRTKESTDA